MKRSVRRGALLGFVAAIMSLGCADNGTSDSSSASDDDTVSPCAGETQSVYTGCGAMFEAFPEGIPEDPIAILGAVSLDQLCDCADAMNVALETCTFREMVADGLEGVPESLADNIGLAVVVCGGSETACPNAAEFVTDDVDPVRDYFEGWEGYATVPASTLESYLSWPCYSFWEAYDDTDPAIDIVDRPWMLNEESGEWEALTPSYIRTNAPGQFYLRFGDSSVELDVFMWRGGDNWYFDYYCFPDEAGNMMTEHLEVVLIEGELPPDWRTTVVKKMSRAGYDVQNRIMDRLIEFDWTCPDTIAWPDPTE